MNRGEAGAIVLVTKKNQVTIYLSDDIRDRIKAIAHQQRRSFSFVVEELLVKGLEVIDPEPKETP